MVFSALLTCRKSVSLLLVCLASFTASCPQSCRCNQNGQMIYVYCRNVNYLRTIPIASIPPVTNTLILWETQLANVPQNAFNGLSNLETIKIHQNPLASIDGNAFKGLSRLEDLHLDDNNLTIVDVDSLRGITNLTRFLATKNNLHTLPDGIFSDLVNLKMLKLGHNKLTSISANLLSGLRKLEFLSMPNNKISHVSETAFDSMASSLLTLDFDHNQLSEFPFDKMENFTSLVELHLKHNNFRTIPPTAKAIFDKIAERKGQIRISQNPLVCSKDLVWLQTWMRNNVLIVSDEDKVTCLTPYRNLSKVRDFDFSTLDKWTIGELKSPPTVTPSAAPPTTSSTASSTASTTTSTTTSSTASSSTSPTMSTRTSPTTSSTASQTTSSTASSTRSSTTSSALSSTTEKTTLLTTLPSTTAEVTLVMSTTQSHPATDKVTTGASSLTGDAEKVTSATTLTQRTTTETDTSPTKSSTTSSPVTIRSAKSTSSSGTEMTSSTSSSTTTARDSQGTTTKGSTYKKISTTKPTALKKKDTSPTVLQITPGSNIDASTTKADKETAGSSDNFLNRNQQVILSASLVGLCIISFVAIMLYLFKRKVMSRQKKLSLRLPRMPYDRVDVV